jgi:peptidoglycan/xylan/chitin deacetylase (PgdA/CDA1 family)
MKNDEEVRRTVRDLCACYHVDVGSFCRDLCMDWAEIVDLATDPLCTIGAHTVNHMMLKKVPNDAMVRAEMEMSRAVLEAALGRRPEHLAFPVGDPTSAGPRENRRDDTARRSVQGTPRLFDRAAAHLGQWRIPAAALFKSADVRRGHRVLEQVPARQRGVASGFAIQLITGIAGNTQPNPATM